MKLSCFSTNEELEVSGVWREIGGGAKLKIARENNPKFVNALRSALSPYKSEVQRATLSDEEANVIATRIISETILLDWDNIQDDDGNNIKYTSEKGFEYMMKYKDFKSLVIRLSKEIEVYRIVGMEEIKDNIKK